MTTFRLGHCCLELNHILIGKSIPHDFQSSVYFCILFDGPKRDSNQLNLKRFTVSGIESTSLVITGV